MLELARAALREDPDVVVLDSVRSADLMTLALTRCSGRLVDCRISRAPCDRCVDGIIDLFPRRNPSGADCPAQNLRGVIVIIAQQTGGDGWRPGNTAQHPSRGRVIGGQDFSAFAGSSKVAQQRHGALNDALAGFVRVAVDS